MLLVVLLACWPAYSVGALLDDSAAGCLANVLLGLLIGCLAMWMVILLTDKLAGCVCHVG